MSYKLLTAFLLINILITSNLVNADDYECRIANDALSRANAEMRKANNFLNLNSSSCNNVGPS